MLGIVLNHCIMCVCVRVYGYICLLVSVCLCKCVHYLPSFVTVISSFPASIDRAASIRVAHEEGGGAQEEYGSDAQNAHQYTTSTAKRKNLKHSSSLNCKDLGERKTVVYEEVVVEEVDKE